MSVYLDENYVKMTAGYLLVSKNVNALNLPNNFLSKLSDHNTSKRQFIASSDPRYIFKDAPEDEFCRDRI